MNDLSENNLHNTITGFPASFDSYAKAVFTIFTFDGEVGDVKVNSYWISTKLHDDLLTKDDIDAFEWKELVVEEFTNDMLKNGNLGTSYLH